MKCKRCQAGIRMAERFMMPDEHMDWNCNNCGENFRIKVKHVDDVGMFLNIENWNEKSGKDGAKSFRFDDDKNVFMEVKA